MKIRSYWLSLKNIWHNGHFKKNKNKTIELNSIKKTLTSSDDHAKSLRLNTTTICIRFAINTQSDSSNIYIYIFSLFYNGIERKGKKKEKEEEIIIRDQTDLMTHLARLKSHWSSLVKRQQNNIRVGL